ncbi:MAG TPA: anhydro-N-acetylmuramic acid kinase [Candidatus Sulfotelmatobacter sp.]
MIVAGVMSGTSADGINVALVRFGVAKRKSFSNVASLHTGAQEFLPPRFQLLGHAEYCYSSQVRRAVLSAMNAEKISVADLARLNFLLGELYADAVLAAQKQLRVRADLIGCHGQTLYHQGRPQLFLGRRIATTWQTGEGAVVAARTGVPVVSDFRPADMAAGGKGAPLVPYLDYLFFRNANIGRIVQNIGGIANLTAISAGADANQVRAFDTGPGNMVIDAVMENFFGKPFDRDGNIASKGEVLEPVLRRVMRMKFFRNAPPKTAGREEFGREFVSAFLRSCGRCAREDAVATATALTVRSIADAVRQFVFKPGERRKRTSWEMVASGGGVRNATLIRMLSDELISMNIRLRMTDELGLPSEAKEAVAFGVLAYETWHRRPSNIPSATGARRPAILGKISYP